jgi:NhaP-type Na+/H+ or K+/H+ antiporter
LFESEESGTFELKNETLLTIAEVALVLVLFGDSSRLHLKQLRGRWGWPGRMLAIGTPLTIGLGGLVALALLGELSLWEAFIVGAILAPTDAALGQTVVSSPKLPLRVRQTLNVESGLNDGISVPFLTLFVALAVAEEEGGSAGEWLVFVAEEIGFGVLIGIGAGLLGAWLVNEATRRGWMTGVFQQLGVAAIALIAWAAAEQVGGNGFIAAFIAGLATGWTLRRGAGEKVLEFTEEEGQLLNLAVFFLFGVLAADLIVDLTWEIVLYALLSLTLIRMLPVSVALIGGGLKPVTVGFLGWFGPRGLASIILALVVLEDGRDLVAIDTIFLAMMATVLLSVLLHGISATPLTDLYAKRADRVIDAEAPEHKDVPDHPTREDAGTGRVKA